MQSKFTSWDQAPLYLSIPEVSCILGISRANAYKLARSEGFPLTRLDKRMVVNKDKLREWLDNQ